MSRWRLTSLPSKGRLARGLLRRMWLPTGQRLHAAALDRRLGEAVHEPEVLGALGQRSPDLVGHHRQRAGPLDAVAQPPVVRSQRGRILRADHHEHVDARLHQPVLPAIRSALAAVAEQAGASGHTLAKLLGEARERGVRHPERPQALVGDRQVQPRVRLLRPGGRGDHLVEHVAQERPRPGRVVDAQEEVAGERQAVPAHDKALDVRQVKLGHAAKRSRNAACSSPGSRLCASSAKPMKRARSSRSLRTSSTVRSP